MIGLSDSLTNALDEVVRRVQRSLVVVQEPISQRHHAQQKRSIGAGVIWQSGGLIVTNRHVLIHDRAMFLLPNGEEQEARLVHQDARLDLALLQVECDSLPPAILADSRSLRIGQWVMAVGHPWGQRGLVTHGVVSSLGKIAPFGRNERHVKYDTSNELEAGLDAIDIIRCDVRLAPGNSGGPLVNAVGAVVGINTMIVGGDLGVAIPSHVVSAFVESTLGAGNRQVSQDSMVVKRTG